MAKIAWASLLSTAVITLAACSDPSDDSATPRDAGTSTPRDGGESPNTYRYPTACKIPADPTQSNLQIVPAFPALAFTYPVDLEHAPDGTNRLFVVERGGFVFVFDNDPDASVALPFLDLTDVVNTNIDAGLLSIAFHPDFANNRYVYARYITGDGPSLRSVVSRFTVDTQTNTADRATEFVIIETPLEEPYHLGGDIAFGPDGLLYITYGDNGPQNDGRMNGQNTTNLHSTIARIDVDSASPYAIPRDNPFANATDGSRPEIFAWGFRNPWRMSFDRLTGNLWTGDCGQDAIEEIDIVTLGGNYGWSQMEGSQCFPPGSACDPTGLTLPVAEYPHPLGLCVIGGFVYRGTEAPSLYGAYVYADVANVLFTFRYGEEAPPTAPLMNTPGTFVGFGEDEGGELYLIQYEPGALFKLVETTTQPAPTDFPQTIADTGCFDDAPALDPIEGVFAYELNAPLWSDHAVKSRFVALPEGGQIEWTAEGAWRFPVGTTFIKHFAIETTVGDPATAVPLETRYLVLDATGTRGYTYRWNDAGTEARLLEGAETRALEIRLPGDANPTTVTWAFPSRTQCITCHNGATGGVLGLETAQLDRDGPLGANQIVALAELGLFTSPPGTGATAFARLDNTSRSVEDRARAYLHSNCGNCHRPGAPAGSTLDLRFTTALAETGGCDAVPSKGDLGVSGARLIAPGDATRSMVSLRMTTPGPYRMPPIASGIVDARGSEVVQQWIDSLAGCE